MKKIFFLLFAMSLLTTGRTQVINTNLQMSANPPATLIDWPLKKEVLTYVAVNQGIERAVLIKADLHLTDGTPVAITNLSTASPRTIGRNASLVLNAADVLPLEKMAFSGRFKTIFARTGKLPAGSYELCVQLVNPGDFMPVSESRCRIFTIAASQLPILVTPADQAILELEKAQTAITFRWTPVAPAPKEVLTYRLTVFEVLEGQKPMQAFRANQPILVKDVVGTTQFIWQPQLGITSCCGDSVKSRMTGDSTRHSGVIQWGDPHENSNGKALPTYQNDAAVFVWSVQTIDSQGRLFGDGNINGDGYSEPIVFYIDRRPPQLRMDKPPTRVIYLNPINAPKR